MKLNFNMSDVPDRVPPLDAGEYFGSIDSCDYQDPKGKRGAGYNLSVKITEGPHAGRKISDFFDADDLKDTKSMSSVRFRHMLLSAGISGTAAEIDTDDLKGKSLHFTVKQSNGTDASGSAVTYANIGQYIYKAS